MVTQHIEIERKFDVEDSFVLPDLSGLDGVVTVGAPTEQSLEAVYFDTADLRLAQARVTVRRRTGGTDPGWHVKLPAGAGARRELHQPLGRAVKAPPKAVLEPVRGIVRRAAASQVATLSTRRLVTTLLAADGRVLAEVADDRVTATALAGAPGEAVVVTAWREVEVELVDGDAELLSVVGAELVVSGARPSSSASKLGRVLGDRLAALTGAPPVDQEPADQEPVDPTGNGQRAMGKKGWREQQKGAGKKNDGAAARTAGDVVLDALRTQLIALQQADLMVRLDEADGVHQVRVAARRLRSILAAFRPVLAREHTDGVRAELQWLGAELSGTRDAEVSLTHLRELVAAQPVEFVLGPVAARLQQAEIQGELGGTEHARQALAGSTYLRLLDSLVELVAAPPLTELAAQPAGPVLTRVVRQTIGRLRRDVRAGAAATDARAHDLALHAVRKAGKRVRYTAEVVAPEFGAAALELVDGMKDVQDVLGDRQDTVVTREQCRQLGLAAFAAGENAWTYGRLHGLEEARAAQAERDFWALWPALRPVLRAARRGGPPGDAASSPG